MKKSLSDGRHFQQDFIKVSNIPRLRISERHRLETRSVRSHLLTIPDTEIKQRRSNMRTKILAFAVASAALLGTSGLALAQQGLSNVPANADVGDQQPYADAGRSTTTGYSDRSDREMARAWQSSRSRDSEALLPRH
jgi:hypothetical protein